MTKREKATKQVNFPNCNPTGKGGFGDNPQNRNPGGWKKEESISYNINKLMRLNKKAFAEYPKKNPEMTIAEEIAWNRLANARLMLNEAVFVTDRTEGKAKESFEFSGEIRTEQRLPTDAERKAAEAYQKELEKHIDGY